MKYGCLLGACEVQGEREPSELAVVLCAAGFSTSSQCSLSKGLEIERCASLLIPVNIYRR